MLYKSTLENLYTGRNMIEEKNRVHEITAKDRSHPQMEEIIGVVRPHAFKVDNMNKSSNDLDQK